MNPRRTTVTFDPPGCAASGGIVTVMSLYLEPRRRDPVRRRVPRRVIVALLLVAVLVALVQVNVLSYAFRSLGLPKEWALAAVVASIAGGALNIPVARLHNEPQTLLRWTPIGWMLTVAPPRPTVLAVNVGGALVPVALSAYVLVRTGIWLYALAGVLAVAFVVHRLAHVIPDVGIAVPAFAPALSAIVVTLLLQPASAAALAYVAGTLGTLIGADLANLRRVVNSGATGQISIGGAGSFDGIVLAGVVAVLVVSVL